MTREDSQTRQPIPEEDSGPPRAHTPSPSEQAEGNLNPFERAEFDKASEEPADRGEGKVAWRTPGKAEGE
jgi:hypothetical protein